MNWRLFTVPDAVPADDGAALLDDAVELLTVDLEADDEVASLAFDGPPPKASDLSRQWRNALDRAGAVIGQLPAERVGEAVLTPDATLFTGDAAALAEARAADRLWFHRGRLAGALPRLKGWPGTRVTS